MEIIIWIVIYALGAILTYGRFTAAAYERSEFVKSNNTTKQVKIDVFLGFLMLLSWVGFLVGILDYFQKKQRYFFKWKS